MALAKKLKQFNKAGLEGVRKASQPENRKQHYVPGDSSSFTRNVTNRTFEPISGGSSYTPMTSSSPSSSGVSSNYPSAERYNEPFNSKWSDELNAMYEQIKNKPKFSYDQSKDPLYQQYAQMYQKNAQLAMGDTMAKASALTGGYANSYAQTAGQQMYNQQMDQLNDKALDLYYAALDKYNAENDDLYKQFGLAGQMYGYDYNAWRDRMADNQWAQNFDYNAYRDAVGDSQWQQSFDYDKYVNDRNFNYQASRDAVSDARYNQEFQYQMARDAESDRRYNNEWNYQVSRDAVSDARYADETAYNRQQANLDRQLQYYQAGYDPLTGGMSAEARQQYNDQLRLNYMKMGMNPDGTPLNYDKYQVMAGNTSQAQYFIQNNGKMGNISKYQSGENASGILSREAFNAKGNIAKVSYTDKNGKIKEDTFSKSKYGDKAYEYYVDAWLNQQPGLTEDEKDYLYYYYTSGTKTSGTKTKK